MPKNRLAASLAVALLLATLALPAVAERPLGDGFDTAAVRLAAEGWDEIAPGAWARTLPNGERQLKASGREGLEHTLGLLKQRAMELLDEGLAAPARAAYFTMLLSLVERIEADLGSRPADGLGRVTAAAAQDPCIRSASVAASATPGPSCGASASASASISSNSWCSTECEVSAQTFAQSSCVASGGLSSDSESCTEQGLNETCTASSFAGRPFQCWAIAAAYVYCSAEYKIEISDYEETESCGSPSAPCEC